MRLALAGQVIERRAPRRHPEAEVLMDGDEVILFEGGEAFAFYQLRADAGGPDAAVGDGAIRSPMPGKIVSVSVGVGQSVGKGQTLLTVEAMKMEHAVAAPFDGVVAELSAALGDQVSEGALLARLEGDQ